MKTLINQNNSPEIEIKSFFNTHKNDFKRDKEYFLELDVNYLKKFNPEIFESLLTNPYKVIPLLEKEAEFRFNKFKILFNNIDNELEINNIRAKHNGHFSNIRGIIKRVTKVLQRTTSITYECPSCGTLIKVKQFYKKKIPPKRCSCGRKGGFPISKEEVMDIQELNLEEIPDNLDGRQPKQIRVYLEEYLTDVTFSKKLQPGKKIEVLGIIEKLPPFMTPKDEENNISEFIINAYNLNSLEDEEDLIITKKDLEQIKKISSDKPLEKLAESLIPEVYGNSVVKRAIVLQLVKGVSKKRSDGSTTREDIHILLSGDVGLAKSVTLRAVTKKVPKANMVVGTKTSRVGLGAMAVKDELTNTWALECGALVLSSGSILCLHPETKVVVGNNFVKISSLEEGRKNKINTKSFSNGKLSNEKISLVSSRNHKGILKKITLDSGLDLLVTPKHKLFNGNNLKWIEAKNFRKGDYLLSSKKILNNPMKEIKIKEIIPREKNNYSHPKEIKLKTLNKEISYLMGFLVGDGSVKKVKGGYIVRISQSKTNQKQINKIMYIYKKIYGEYPAISIIKKGRYKAIKKDGTRIIGNDSVQIRIDKKIFYLIYWWYKNNFINLPNKLLFSYLAGVFDADGCISTKKCLKKEKIYKINHAEIMISNNLKENQDYVFALRRLGIYSRIRQKVKNLKTIILTGNKDILLLSKYLKEDSIKFKKFIPLLKKTDISSSIEKLPMDIVSNVCKEISKCINKSILIKRGVWSYIWYYKNKKIQPSIIQLSKIYTKLKDLLKKEEDINRKIKFLLGMDFFPEKIVKIENFNYNGKVYDLTIPSTQNFLSNLYVVHNCVDELDKMYKENLSELLEPMSSGTISINKAGISAKLPARTSILASANPIHGNFNLKEPLAKQLDLPTPIINRFDLIFILLDRPNPTFDKNSIEHIFNSYKNINEPEIKRDLFRKYIFYCKKLRPILREELLNDLQDFYVEIRKKSFRGSDEGLPINLRNMEGLIRLSEAHAKIRLSKYVEKEDFEIAKSIFLYCLKQVGTDYETGLIDTSMMTERLPVSKRGKVEKVLDILERLTNEHGKMIPISLLIENSKDCIEKKWEIDEIIEKLESEGRIFRPRKGEVSLL